MITKRYIDELTYQIIGCAIEVHKHLGPGLLESIYEKCLILELKSKGLHCDSQQIILVNYKGTNLDCDLRYDILVENLIVVEVKATNTMHPIFEAQTLTYMKLLKKPKGILINFNVQNIFHEGQKTFVNEFYRALTDNLS